MDMVKNKVVGKCMRQLRKEQHLTQSQVARRLDVPQSFVSKVETGERSLRVSELFSYSFALGTSPKEIVSRLEICPELYWR